MTAPSNDRPVSTGRVVWCLRVFGWIPVILALILAAGGLLVFSQSSGYEAQALLVVRKGDTNARTLPPYATAVFYNGAVARAVAADPSFAAAPGDLVPTRLDVVVPKDSITLLVIGRDDDPAVAARLADAGATAFVEELNRGGPGIGTFSVENRAAVPGAPVGGFPAALAAAIGALVGAVLGLGVVVLIAVIRRPVVAAEDVESVLGTRLIGNVVLPRPQRGRFRHPREASGITAVARRVGAAPTGPVLVISDPRDTFLREQVVVMLDVVLSGLRPIALHGPAPVLEAAQALRGPQLRWGPGTRPLLDLVDGGDAVDLLERTRNGAAVVLIAVKGAPASRVRAAAANHLRPELLGVVLVESRRTGGRKARSRPAAPARRSERVPV
jgi:hypothetical protein